jgi:hypothetical protein
MKTPVMTGRKRSVLFAVLSAISFFACFIFAPLGGFIVWIFGGAFVYFLFMTVYSLIPAKRQQFIRRRLDPRQAETKAYIASHKPILISVFVAAIALVLAILMMFL